MQMPGRHTESESYRYAYNGMETDNEVSGNGNSYTTEFRQYDPRLGRWKSLDPLMGMFPDMSPYVAFDNNPVYYVDPYGLSSSTDNEPVDPDGIGDAASSASGAVDRVLDLAEVEVKSSGNYDTTPNTIEAVANDKYYYVNNQNVWEEAPNMAYNSVKGRVVKILHQQYLIEGNRAFDQSVRERENQVAAYHAEQNRQYMQDAEHNRMMMSNPITALYTMSPFHAGVEAGVEVKNGEYAAAAGIIALEFLPGPTEDIIKSSRRAVKGVPAGRRALQKKIDGKGKSKYFSDVKLGSGNTSAEDIIRSVMDHPQRVMLPTRVLGRNTPGEQTVIPFLNPDTGQAVALDSRTGEFVTFLNRD